MTAPARDKAQKSPVQKSQATKDRPWLIRTYAGHSTAAKSNELYRTNLAKGQTGLSIAFDLPTQTGYDPDDELARGEVGKPIVIRPLANDLPGSDPRTADARLTLGGDITPKANLKVTTDQRSGLVTVIATRPGPYFLDYVAAFGSARVDRSQIRVDVAKDAAGFVPQTMPDQAAIRGNNPVRVDVLANDADPQGGPLSLLLSRQDARLFAYRNGQLVGDVPVELDEPDARGLAVFTLLSAPSAGMTLDEARNLQWLTVHLSRPERGQDMLEQVGGARLPDSFVPAILGSLSVGTTLVITDRPVDRQPASSGNMPSRMIGLPSSSRIGRSR